MTHPVSTTPRDWRDVAQEITITQNNPARTLELMTELLEVLPHASKRDDQRRELRRG